MLLLGRGNARDKNLKHILAIMDESRYFILDPAFQKHNDVALPLSETI